MLRAAPRPHALQIAAPSVLAWLSAPAADVRTAGRSQRRPNPTTLRGHCHTGGDAQWSMRAYGRLATAALDAPASAARQQSRINGLAALGQMTR